MLSQLTLHIYILDLCAGWEGTKCLDEYLLICVHMLLTAYVLHVQVAHRGINTLTTSTQSYLPICYISSVVTTELIMFRCEFAYLCTFTAR